jgi:glutamyl-tRNA synthetase
MNPNVITRFPPSPTGLLQAGNVRTAIFNYLFARKHGGKFILRIEDTDRERSKKEFENNILDTLQWLGLSYDGEALRQSDRLARHQEVLRDLIARDLAYVSKEEVTEEGQPARRQGRHSEVIRFRNRGESVTFTDLIRGPITFDTSELGDFIIARSIDEPLYHLGVVVDDADSGVTHVIRGEDHISNTPRQILIGRAMGQEPPLYAHLPLLLGTDRAKLSKRKGAKAITQYRDEGFVPEAVINYLAMLGWHPEDDQELFSLDELVKIFDLTRVQKAGAVFDEAKLRWFNHEHLKMLSDTEFAKRLEAFSTISTDLRIIPLLRERSQTLKEAADALAAGEYDFLNETLSFNTELLLKGAKSDEQTVKNNLQKVAELIETMPDEAFTAESVKNAVFEYATKQGRASVLWPLRVCLSGKEKSPDPFTLCALLGKEKTLARIAEAAKML